jgi:hypothetical protein
MILIYRSSLNGVDPEYAIGRVARKIWAKAMKIMVLTNVLKC